MVAHWGSLKVFPACAGMIRKSTRRNFYEVGVPRMRGDDPGNTIEIGSGESCSPHARG